MSIYPSPDKLDNVESKYALVIMSAKRARQIKDGARRLTGIKVSAPTPAGLPPAASFVNSSGAAELVVGREWLMEVELDFGAQNQTLDLRPQVPLVIRF